LEISALEADGKGKVVSSPRVVTADQTKAEIEQGTEFPYPVTAPNGATVIAFKKAVLKLEVLPQITPEGNIIMDLTVNKDSPGEILQNVRAINTKRVKTQVLVENGGTVVIGGIFEIEETDGETKVPFLGDVPVGWQSVQDDKQRKQKTGDARLYYPQGDYGSRLRSLKI
jgi:type IV pilus assembly protein PilQ